MEVILLHILIVNWAVHCFHGDLPCSSDGRPRFLPWYITFHYDKVVKSPIWGLWFKCRYGRTCWPCWEGSCWNKFYLHNSLHIVNTDMRNYIQYTLKGNIISSIYYIPVYDKYKCNTVWYSHNEGKHKQVNSVYIIIIM